MRNLLSLAVLSVLLTLLWGYWTQIRSAADKPQAEAKQTVTERPLLTFDPTKVGRLELHWEGRPGLVVRRGADHDWSLESPFQAGADTYLAERALTVLSRLTAAQTIHPAPGSPDSLSQFGLSPDNAPSRIVIQTDQTTHWLELGAPAPNRTRQYARSSDLNGIALIEQQQIRPLPREATELLDRRILPLATEPLQTILVTHGPTTLSLQAGGLGWMLESPVQAPADRPVMTEWLRRLTTLTAETIAPASQEEHRRPPGTRVGSIRMTAGRVSLSADVFRAGDSILVRRSDQPALWFRLSTAALTLLFPDPFGLQDKHVIRTEVEALSQVVFRNQGRPVTLVRTPSGWERDGRPLAFPQSEAIERWLTDLHLSEGSAPLPSLARCGVLASSRWTLTLHGEGGRPVGRVDLARTKSCGAVATLPTGEWVRLQGTSLLDQLPVSSG